MLANVDQTGCAIDGRADVLLFRTDASYPPKCRTSQPKMITRTRLTHRTALCMSNVHPSTIPDTDLACKYAQRGVMKSLRNVKLRTFCSDSADLFLGRSQNPLKEVIAIQPSHALTQQYLQSYRTPPNTFNTKTYVQLSLMRLVSEFFSLGRFWKHSYKDGLHGVIH